MIDDTINDAQTMRGGGAALGRIDQYELVRELGGGGFGTVYLAKDTVAGIEVAVKGLPPIIKNNAEELERIRENFALVSRLHHPYIAAALHLQLAKDVAYRDESVRQKLRVMPGDTLMVMEYAPGVTLSKWRKQFPDGKVPLDVAIQLVWQIAQALDYAHEQHIIHRDIKPSNIMVETKPDGEIVARLLDFGLAAEIRSSMGRVSREIHDTSGTRPYMAPEQWEGRKQGPATDQYALAVLLCELLTGEVPFASAFETGDPIVMMTAVCNREVELPEDCPRKAALLKALAKDPSQRFASCMEFVEAAAKSERTVPHREKLAASQEDRKQADLWCSVMESLLVAARSTGRMVFSKSLELYNQARKEFTNSDIPRHRRQTEKESVEKRVAPAPAQILMKVELKLVIRIFLRTFVSLIGSILFVVLLDELGFLYNKGFLGSILVGICVSGFFVELIRRFFRRRCASFRLIKATAGAIAFAAGLGFMVFEVFKWRGDWLPNVPGLLSFFASLPFFTTWRLYRILKDTLNNPISGQERTASE